MSNPTISSPSTNPNPPSQVPKASKVREHWKKKQQYKFQFASYIWSYIYIFFVSYGVPLLIGGLYLTQLVLPSWGIFVWANYPNINPYVASDSVFNQEWGFFKIFAQAGPAMYYFLTLPLVLIGLYLLNAYLTAVTGRQILRTLERRVPAQEGVIERRFVDPDPQEFRKLIYYHSRNFILRIVKWKFTKGFFPWLQNWAFRYMGEKVGKGVTFEPEFFASELATYEDGVYIGPGALASSHVVEGVWGRVVLMPVFMGKRSCACGKNIIGCGTIMDERSVLLPQGALAKAFHLRANQYYDGIPAVRILPKKLKKEYFEGKDLPEIPESVLKEWGINTETPSPKNQSAQENNGGN